MSGTSRPDTDRVQVLSRLAFNNGNVAKTARETHVPRTTVIRWRDQANEDAGQDVGAIPALGTPNAEGVQGNGSGGSHTANVDTLKGKSWDAIRIEAGQEFLGLARQAQTMLQRELTAIEAEGERLPASLLKSVAVVFGISAQRAGDLLKDPEQLAPLVDARQVFAGLSTDDLRELARDSRAARGAGETIEVEATPPPSNSSTTPSPMPPVTSPRQIPSRVPRQRPQPAPTVPSLFPSS